MKTLIISIISLLAFATVAVSQEQTAPKPEQKPEAPNVEKQDKAPRGPAMHQGEFNGRRGPGGQRPEFQGQNERGPKGPMYRGGPEMRQGGKKNHPCQCPCHERGGKKQQRR